MTSSPAPMLSATLSPYRLLFREVLGIAHEDQVVEVPIPEGGPAFFHLREAGGGRRFPVQASRRHPGRGYIRLSLSEGETLELELEPETGARPAAAPEGGLALAGWRVGNGVWEIEFAAESGEPERPGSFASGPVARFRAAGGPWRGATFFDTTAPRLRAAAEWLEAGPLRAVYRYRAEFGAEGSGRFYEATVTADASADFLRFEERFEGAASDQLVWDFAGKDLPVRIDLLDSTAGSTPKDLSFHYDFRHARLWGWTQFSQLHDLSDGFAIRFPGAADAVGWVALEGGSWDGNALNHLEAWSRRWEDADLSTRRLPLETKADSISGPASERVPARGRSVCSPRFSVEGWLRRGRRQFALVLSAADALEAPEAVSNASGERGCSPALAHFEEVPDRVRYRAQQGRLRRIHIRHGLMPLQAQLGMTFAWPLEGNLAPGASVEGARRRALDLGQFHRPPPPEGDPERIGQLDAYLAARVLGFWEGSGAAYSNCVVGRKIGPEMLRAEDLARRGLVDRETLERWRGRFAFLAYLNASENYYPGPATMAPLGASASTEPTLAGMANQNFYTDVISVFGYAAQAFPGHPEAGAWRARFLDQWERQLACHVYPESGLWEESHTYYQHVLHTVLPLLMRRREDGAGDGFADPAFRRMVAAVLVQIAPRNAAAGGVRHLVPFGDHGVDTVSYRHLYGDYARAFLPHDPVLAGRLAWLAVEAGEAGVPAEELAGLAPSAPPWESGPVAGLGYFFRDRDAAGVETLLALRSGTAWGHHHNDEGAIQLYAKGHAMIVDAAFSRYQERGERKVSAAGHSRAAVEGVEPLHYLWRCNRGWIVASGREGALSYAVAGIPLRAAAPRLLPLQPLPCPLLELRAVVRLALDAYLIADRLDPRYSHCLRFHVGGTVVEADGTAVLARFAGGAGLRIAPLGSLFSVAPPSFSIDRAVGGRVEETTSVEYAGITGPWSVFLVEARGPDERFAGIGAGTKIAVEADRLVIHREGDRLSLDPSLL
ncbi:MAG TPA: hypothetical protein VIM58_01205, partial [Candidatus Methylacidiphilales bacterium]